MLGDGGEHTAVSGSRASSRPGRAGAAFRLAEAVTDIYTGASLGPVLRQLLAQNGRLLHTVAGSVSLVHAEEGRYSKLAERGVPCGLGHTFPLDEGVTGRAVARRRPVALDDYQEVRSGHLPRTHPASQGWSRCPGGAPCCARTCRTGLPRERRCPSLSGSAKCSPCWPDGLTDRAMARALVVSPKTIEKHVGAVLRKTRTASRTAAVVRAIENGWLTVQ